MYNFNYPKSGVGIIFSVGIQTDGFQRKIKMDFLFWFPQQKQKQTKQFSGIVLELF